MQEATWAGASSTSAPRAASTSALPHFDEAARLPCLATRAPAAAATNADAVEMLKACAHGLGGAGDLVGRLALHAQRDEQRGHLRGGRGSREHRLDRGAGLLAAQ